MVSLPPPDRLELFYDGQWHDRTGDLRVTQDVTMSRGLTAEGSRAAPSAADMLLDNRHGDYSKRDPNSALYGKIGPNTPLRYSVEAGHPYLLLPGDTTSALTTPDHASLDVTDLDLRLEVALDDYTVNQELAARFEAAGNQRHFTFRLINSGQMWFEWYPDGTSGSQKSAGSLPRVPANPGQRIALRVVLDVNDGAGGHLVSFYWAPTINATRWHLLDTDTGGAGTTVLPTGTAGLQLGTNVGIIGNGAAGRIYAMQLWDGATGTRKVDLDLSTAEAGDTSLTDGGGRMWTLTGAATLANRHVRLAAEVPAWPPQQDLTGADQTVPITPAGITRRLDAGNKPLDSAIRRYLQASGAVECWPLTDGTEATWGASLRSGRPMTVYRDGDAPQWGKGALADWIEPTVLCPPGTAGTLVGHVPDLAATGGWSVDLCRADKGILLYWLIYDRGAGTDADNQISYSILMQAPLNQIIITRNASGATSSSTALLVTITNAGIFDNKPHHLRFKVDTTTPGTTPWSLWIDGVLAGSGTDTITPKPVQRVEADWQQIDTTLRDPMALGYVTYWGPAAPGAAEVFEALTGWPGETAGARFLRVCAEAGVPAYLIGDDDEQVRLGTQRAAKFLDVLQAGADADLGYVLEHRAERALVYRGHDSLYNQDPALTLDFSQGVISQPFRPLDDDKLARNDITVQRRGGSFGFAVLEDGPLSVQDPPDGIGRYDVAHTLSLADDDQPAHQASWRLHMGTYNGLRYTKITLNMGNPRVWAMARDIYLADVGDKIRLTNLPASHGPDDVDLLILGYAETVGEERWTITFTCAPGAPWDVAVLGDRDRGRSNTSGCTLGGGGVSASATTLTLVTAAGASRWIDSATYPSSFPFDVVMGGERIRITAITGTTLTQTANAVRSQNGVIKAHAAGTPVRLARPAIIAL
ncbi:hypothetical protein [Streptomyces sp. NPDC093111]|uniref:hypothetical protein n=1 Tax=Streptomyces sp. NPDC093111 TaxID=3154978 RepID=UPI003435AA25